MRMEKNPELLLRQAFISFLEVFLDFEALGNL
jgi:hypothetical protein